jgi:hypothetical protein
MSFLLGGIDFVTIIVSLIVLFMWSLWACAICLFSSTLLKSRAMSGVVFGAVAVVLFIVFGLGRTLFLFRAGVGVGVGVGGGGGTGTEIWWALAIATTICAVTMINLVLLAENRLSLPTENRATPLRVGFLVQFLLIAAWILTFINEAPRIKSNAVEALGVVGGWHLAIVAMFTVTEDLAVPRRVLRRMMPLTSWRRLLAMLQPGGGRGAVYVLVQMVLLVFTAWLFDASWITLRWFLAICGYICFFTGVPALVFRLLKTADDSSLRLRVVVLLLVPVSMILPDVVHYVVWRPEVLDLSYSARHLLNPLRTLANWPIVEARQWTSAPLILGMTGLLAYVALIVLGTRATEQPEPIDPRDSADAAGEPDRAHVIY